MLRVDDRAPSFTANDAIGNELSLDKLLQTGPVALLFSRYVGCPICQQRFSELAAGYEKFKKLDAHIYAVVGGSVERTRRFMEQHRMPNIFLPDPRRALYDLYQARPGGVRHFMSLGTAVAAAKAVAKGRMQGMPEGNMFQLPADFVIGRDGLIKLAHYGRHFGDRTTNEELLRIISA